MATSQDPLAWRRQFCKGQWKEQEEEEDRRRDGNITSRNGREWGLEIPWGQRKTGKDGKVLLQRHLWCLDDLQGLGTEMRWESINALTDLSRCTKIVNGQHICCMKLMGTDCSSSLTEWFCALFLSFWYSLVHLCHHSFPRKLPMLGKLQGCSNIFNCNRGVLVILRVYIKENIMLETIVYAFVKHLWKKLFHYFCYTECSLYLVDLGSLCAFYVLCSKISSSSVNIMSWTDLNIYIPTGVTNIPERWNWMESFFFIASSFQRVFIKI